MGVRAFKYRAGGAKHESKLKTRECHTFFHYYCTSWGTQRCTGKQSDQLVRKLCNLIHPGIPCACSYLSISERDSLCPPRHSICLQPLINPIAHVHPGIPSYPSVKSPLLFPLLLPLPIPTSFPFPPFPSPPPHTHCTYKSCQIFILRNTVATCIE